MTMSGAAGESGVPDRVKQKLPFEYLPFEEVPFEDLPVADLGISELEARLRVGPLEPQDAVSVSVSVSW